MAKAKKKKKTKNKSFYKTIKPFIRDNRVLYSILGAVGVGVALASALGTEKGRSIVDRLTTAVKDMGSDQLATNEAEPEVPVAERRMKAPKPFAAE